MVSNKVLHDSSDEYGDVVIITPSDTVLIKDDATNNPLEYPYVNAIQVTVTGNFKVVAPDLEDGTTKVITITGAPVGSIWKFPIVRINATDTTGSAIGLIRR